MDKISDLKEIVITTLDLNKAEDIVTIDLKDKSSMADYMIIASGTSSRHIQSLSEQVLEKLKDNGIKDSKIEGKESGEWKLTLNTLKLEDVLKLINKVVFASGFVNNFNDPFILCLNLKTNSNVKCLNNLLFIFDLFY